MKNLLILIISVLSFNLSAQNRSIILLNNGWKFINKEVSIAEKPGYNDQSWEDVNVPHDWAISGHFDMNIDLQWTQVIEDGEKKPRLRTGRTGALPEYGVGWYRINLPVTTADKDQKIYLEFDGAMSLTKIYVNGVYVGEHPYGYSSFSFDITKYIQLGSENVLAVRLENKPESSRWYSGAGLYRNVRIVKTEKTHVSCWGTFITTPQITKNKAVVNIRTEIENDRPTQDKVKLVTEIYNASGQKVASVSSTQSPNNQLTFNQNTQIKNPELWSIETPVLYKAVSTVFVNNVITDEYTTTFGCRSIRFDKDSGFFLNEKPVKIQGVCMHHDLGALGVAVNYRATQRQMEMMKEMGANAIRTSHNPPSPELIQICDSIGLLVIEEAFDEWKDGKNKNGYANYFDEWAKSDIESMVRRDRNHPCIIAWSIGNEIREQNTPNGKEVAKFLAETCKLNDPTRPTTAGFNNHNGAIKNGLADVVDLVGFNYKPYDYAAKHKQYPDYILFGSETASTVSSRGEYKFPAVEKKGPWYNDYQVSSYDLEYPNWASTADTEFEAQDDNDFIFGEFVWTGFDYLGEPTPYNEGTPARSSYFGIVDLAGLKKDRFYLYQSKWSDKPVLHLLPHWNWEDRLGQNVPVFCYTNYPKAELFVNGKSMGVKEKNKSSKYTRYRLMWDNLIYEPGEIKIIAYNDKNDSVASEVIKTAGEPYAVKLTVDRQTINANGKDLAFVTVEVVDKGGNLCPRANNLLFFEVNGNGRLKALCNGDATDQTSFVSNYMRVFSGKLVATVESGKILGDIELTVSGGLLKKETIQIKIK